MKLKNKIAVVTGASSGIGAHFCERLIARGATVYGVARRGQMLDKMKEKLGGNFVPVAIDITQHQHIQKWVDDTFSGETLPDILINNAGVGHRASIEHLSTQKWDAMIQTNLSAVFYMCQSMVPLMKKNPSVCHIINVASVAGIVANEYLSGYNASKFGLRGFSEALFKELRYDGIKVSCLLPASIATPFFADSAPHANKMPPEEIANAIEYLLTTPDNVLVNELVMRPLNPKAPKI